MTTLFSRECLREYIGSSLAKPSSRLSLAPPAPRRGAGSHFGCECRQDYIFLEGTLVRLQGAPSVGR